jgi:glycosyltransferase involved in cell wall biosynthesis
MESKPMQHHEIRGFWHTTPGIRGATKNYGFWGNTSGERVIASNKRGWRNLCILGPVSDRVFKSMNTSSDVTIVVPAKNEARLIPKLLDSLARQDYSKMASTRVLVADARSTDGTPEVVLKFRDRLKVEVIPGGLPSTGRNNGARLADTRYVLFLDADVELASRSLLREAIEIAEKKDLQCLTTNILCRDGSLADKVLYIVGNIMQHLSCLHRPFSTGMFMMFELNKFRELGGFDERIHYAEDYCLSSQVKCSRFRILSGPIYTTNRRLTRMGHLRVVWLFLWTALNSWNEDYFLRDHRYWAEERKS